MKARPPGRRSPLGKLLVSSAALIALAVTPTACGGGGGNGEGTAATQSGTENAGAVSVQSLAGAGRVLVDSSGRALYTSNLEANGKVVCTGGCNSIWKPATPAGGSQASSMAKVGVISRPDGSKQLTYAGMPLYSFTEEGPEEVTGDGFVDEFNGHRFTWSVASVEGGSGGSAGAGGEGEPSSSGGRYGY